MHDINFKMSIFYILNAVTVTILGRPAIPNKTLGAQQHIMVNIHGRFRDFIANTVRIQALKY